jgi:hypothetical protein
MQVTNIFYQILDIKLSEIVILQVDNILLQIFTL